MRMTRGRKGIRTQGKRMGEREKGRNEKGRKGERENGRNEENEWRTL